MVAGLSGVRVVAQYRLFRNLKNLLCGQTLAVCDHTEFGTRAAAEIELAGHIRSLTHGTAPKHTATQCRIVSRLDFAVQRAVR